MAANAYRLQGLEGRPLERIIDELEWHEDGNATDFQRRQVEEHYQFTEGSEGVPRTRTSSVLSQSSSMALTQTSHTEVSSRWSSNPPSLVSSTTTGTGSSIDSGYGHSFVREGPFNQQGFLDRDATMPSPAGIYCPFHFLGCTEQLPDFDSWDEHSKSHFLGRELPQHIACPFNCTWAVDAETGEKAWEARQTHILVDHPEFPGMMLEWDMPCGTLLRHLWNIRVIDSAELQEIRRHGRLGQDTQAYTLTVRGGRSREGRLRAGASNRPRRR